MHLTRLDVSNVRNLASVHLEPATGINYFYGENGAGKTSLLEAISLLSVGRSFRSGKITTVIRGDDEELTVSGSVRDDLRETSNQVGISRQKDSMVARIDGQNISRLSALATAVPIVVISTKNHELVEGGPGERRQFLDWILFHVEPNYVKISKRYKLTLSQRNAVLRSGGSAEMISAWNNELAESGEVIAQQRQVVCQQVSECLQSFSELLPMDSILPELQYRRGWAEGQALLENLENAVDNMKSATDCRAGSKNCWQYF